MLLTEPAIDVEQGSEPATSDRRHDGILRHTQPGRRAGESTEDQRLVLQTLVRLADSLSASESIHEVMSHLIIASAQLVAHADASVLLADDKNELSVFATTSELKQVFDHHQIQTGQGSILDVFRSGDACLGISLKAKKETWPGVAPLLVAVGMRTMNTLPICYHGTVVGVLDLCDPREFALSPLQVEILTLLATSAGVGIGNLRIHRGNQILVNQLQEALDSRIIIEQAKGVIAARLEVGVDQAFQWLRSLSRNRNRRIHDVARLIVEGGLPAEAVRPH